MFRFKCKRTFAYASLLVLYILYISITLIGLKTPLKFEFDIILFDNIAIYPQDSVHENHRHELIFYRKYWSGGFVLEIKVYIRCTPTTFCKHEYRFSIRSIEIQPKSYVHCVRLFFASVFTRQIEFTLITQEIIFSFLKTYTNCTLI